MTLGKIKRLIKNRYIMISIRDAEGVRHYLEFDKDDRDDRRKLAKYDEAEVTAIRAAVSNHSGYEQLIVLTLA